MTPPISIPPTGPARSGPNFQFAIQPPAPATAPGHRRQAPTRLSNKNAAQPTSSLVGYSLAHEIGATRKILGKQKTTFTRFAAAPVTGSRPQKGVRRFTVTCLTCHEVIPVLVRSPASVTLERWKRAVYVVLTALVFYAFTVLIPWNRLLGSYDTCIGLVIFFAFGAVALYNAARVIAPAGNPVGRPRQKALPRHLPFSWQPGLSHHPPPQTVGARSYRSFFRLRLGFQHSQPLGLCLRKRILSTD